MVTPIVKAVFTALAYLAMLTLILLFFEGNGAFIYEGF